MWIQNYKRVTLNLKGVNLDSQYNAPRSTFWLDPFPVDYLNDQQEQKIAAAATRTKDSRGPPYVGRPENSGFLAP